MTKVLLRIAVMTAAVVGGAFLLSRLFDDLEPGAIADAVRSLSRIQILALAVGWAAMITAQGVLTAALIPQLAVRRGVLAFLGPTAVSSVIPGPSDLPLRHRMFTSWNVPTSEATIAVSASGVFSIGSRLVLPVVAAAGLVLTGAPLSGPLVTVTQIALLVGVGTGIFVFVIASESRLTWVADKVERLVRRAERLLDRDEDRRIVDAVLAARNETVDMLRARWMVAAVATIAVTGLRCALLIMALRFSGVPEEAIGWSGIFVAFAFVQGLNALPILPGNVGVTEVAYITMLSAGAGGGLANELAAGVLIHRLLTWLVIMPAGLVAIGLWRQSTRRQEERTSTTSD